MRRPKYSIVIPTRNRHRTLRHCLETVLCQDHSDYEVVIADNASTPETRQVCESFNSPYIRHARCDTPLSMNNNWERALQLARGEWIAFLGDDDGLMPYSLQEFDFLTRKYDCKAFQSQYAIYTWPCLPLAGEENRLQITRSTYTDQQTWRPAVQSMLKLGGSPVPMIYYGLIHHDLVTKARQTGQIFCGYSPDYYSGVLFARIAGTFIRTDIPLFVAGLSGKSNGVAHLRSVSSANDPVTVEFAKLNAADGLKPHRDLPDYTVNHAQIGALDPIFRVRDRLFPNDKNFQKTPIEIARIYLGALSCDPDTQTQQIASLRRYLDWREPGVDFNALMAKYSATVHRSGVIMKGGQVGQYGHWEVVDTEQNGISNVAEAARYAQRILNYRPGKITYTTRRFKHLRRLTRAATLPLKKRWYRRAG